MKFTYTIALALFTAFASGDIADQYPASKLYSKPAEVIPHVFSAIGATAPRPMITRAITITSASLSQMKALWWSTAVDHTCWPKRYTLKSRPLPISL